jgi:hypothetical protein
MEKKRLSTDDLARDRAAGSLSAAFHHCAYLAGVFFLLHLTTAIYYHYP